MKEAPEKQLEFDPETYTDPILEECYRIKAEISAQFKKPGEYYAYLKKVASILILWGLIKEISVKTEHDETPKSFYRRYSSPRCSAIHVFSGTSASVGCHQPLMSTPSPNSCRRIGSHFSRISGGMRL